ncbi:putative nuclease HARBI1 [Bacillus rossius redtenbacheri]|uniref:putative nuclease HARBI1 n=1 Tax=Bacillus rossius redtenbacheri TaxID=93214 RepID=UPI002FDE4481
MEAVGRIVDDEFVKFVRYARDVPYNPPPRKYLRDGDNPLECFSDEEFVKRFRFTKETVIGTIVPLVAADNGDKRGLPVPAIVKVTTALRFYGSNSFQIVCGDLIHLNQATVSRIIKVTSNELAGHLLQYAHFPGPGGIRSNQRKFYDLGEFPGVTGCIDCTHICISNPGGQFPELYRNRKQYMSLNVQVVAGPNLEIMDIVTRWPGSTHDARIFSNSRVMVRFENQGLPGILLGDNGYPQLPFLYTPVLVPTTAAEIRYNLAHRRTRNIVERLFGVWKRRFACLGQKLRTKLATSNKVILACAVLHNIAVQHEEPLPPPVEELRVLPIVPVANLRPRNHRGAAMRAMFIERHFV